MKPPPRMTLSILRRAITLPALWSAVAVLALFDIAGCMITGLRIGETWIALTVIAALIGIAAPYRLKRTDLAFADALEAMALFVALMVAGTIMIYVASRTTLPLRDAELTRLDAALGADWVAWSDLLARHPVWKIALFGAYMTYLPQAFFAAAYLGWTRRRARFVEFFAIATLGLVITAIIAGVFPALGVSHWRHYGPTPDFTIHLTRLRDVSPSADLHFAMRELTGLVSFPSYHATIGLALIYAARGSRALLAAALALNLPMIASVPSAGLHYVADVPGGLAVCLVAIAIARLAGWAAPAA